MHPGHCHGTRWFQPRGGGAALRYGPADAAGLDSPLQQGRFGWACRPGAKRPARKPELGRTGQACILGRGRAPISPAIASCGSGAPICATALRSSSASPCTNAAWASCCGDLTFAAFPFAHRTRNPIPKPRRRSKKLRSARQGSARRARHRQAGRGLVPGRSKSWPEGTLTRIWARRGSRPRALRDRRFTWAYLFGAVCPVRGVGAALVLPAVNIEAMTMHLAEISRCVTAGAIALLIVDGAGWHSSPKLAVPENIVLLKLPPFAPELNPAENIWEYLRGNALSHQVWESYEAIVDACCGAWTGLMRTPDIIRSIATRDWAHVRI